MGRFILFLGSGHEIYPGRAQFAVRASPKPSDELTAIRSGQSRPGPSLDQVARLAHQAEAVLSPARLVTQAILNSVGAAFGIDPARLRQPHGDRQILAAKQAVALLALERLSPDLTRETVAQLLRLPVATLYRYQAAAKANPDPAWIENFYRARANMAEHLDALRVGANDPS